MPPPRSRARSPGTFTYTTGGRATVLSTAGTRTLNVIFTPTDTTDFTNATATVQIVVGNTGSYRHQRIARVSQRRLLLLQSTNPVHITVSGSTAAPTGTVNVIFNGQTLGTGTLVPGSGATSTATLYRDQQLLLSW